MSTIIVVTCIHYVAGSCAKISNRTA